MSAKSTSNITMAELLARAKNKVQQFTKGQRVSARVLSKSDTNVIFDIGGKSEGIVKEKAYKKQFYLLHRHKCSKNRPLL